MPSFSSTNTLKNTIWPLVPLLERASRTKLTVQSDPRPGHHALESNRYVSFRQMMSRWCRARPLFEPWKWLSWHCRVQHLTQSASYLVASIIFMQLRLISFDNGRANHHLNKVCLLVRCLTYQQHAGVFQGRVCSDNFNMLPHWDRSCKSNFLSHPVTVYWRRANHSQRRPLDTWRLAG